MIYTQKYGEILFLIYRNDASNGHGNDASKFDDYFTV